MVFIWPPFSSCKLKLNKVLHLIHRKISYCPLLYVWNVLLLFQLLFFFCISLSHCHHQIQTQVQVVTGLVSLASLSLTPLSLETKVIWISVTHTFYRHHPSLMYWLLLTNNLILLNDFLGQFGHLLPEDQIQPTCEEAYAGALSIITYVHDKTFNSGGVPNTAITTMMIWSTVLALSFATGVLV